MTFCHTLMLTLPLLPVHRCAKLQVSHVGQNSEVVFKVDRLKGYILKVLSQKKSLKSRLWIIFRDSLLLQNLLIFSLNWRNMIFCGLFLDFLAWISQISSKKPLICVVIHILIYIVALLAHGPSLLLWFLRNIVFCLPHSLLSPLHLQRNSPG